MSAKIEVLSQETINQIAAGEVIDRPSSVVKELVENAIDAGATAVTVETKEGGLSLIRVTDNGRGIDREDIRVAFLRHATSKIKTAIDLMTVSTLGFRGEALSSIAAVCQVELITRTKEDLTAVRYQIEGGKEISFQEVGAPYGTSFFVRNLFFNTPARRKFLKSAQTEGGYIAELMYSMALSHPEVSFQLIQNGQNRLYTTGTNQLADTCYSVFGRVETASFLEIKKKTTTEEISISGFIAAPSHSRGNRSDEYYFINGRFIKSKVITKAIEDGYHGFLMQHRYPATVLFIELPAYMIDVNVHPSKMEIRFKDEPLIYKEIKQVIFDRLRTVELIPNVGVKDEKLEVKPEIKKTIAPEPFFKERTNPPLFSKPDPIIAKDIKATSTLVTIPENKEHEEQLKPRTVLEKKLEQITNVNMVKEPKGEYVIKPSVPMEETTKTKIQELGKENVNTSSEPKPVPKTIASFLKKTETTPEASIPTTPSEKPVIITKEEEQLTLFEEKLLSKEARVKHKLIGQLFDTYWLLQYEDKLYIMDQHAAHEKVLYEKNVKIFREHQATSQLVSPPIVLNLRPREVEALKNHMELFSSLGYEMEEFGLDTYCVRAVPNNLYDFDQQQILGDLLSDLTDNAMIRGAEEYKTDKWSLPVLTDKLATMSCKAAIKGNMSISFQEADALIEQLLQLDNPYNCPHGRPTIISMTKYEIERKFARKI